MKGDSLSADFCLVTDKIMPENPHIHPMWTGSKQKEMLGIVKENRTRTVYYDDDKGHTCEIEWFEKK